jgi:hypothetical protein
MPTHTQRTVNIDSTTRGLGNPPSTFSTSDSESLATCFPASPIHAGTMTPDTIKAQYQDEILNGVINDEGHTFGTFDTSYSNAPDLAEEVDTDAHNLPSAFVPNPTSPGPGSINASDKPPAPDGFGQTPADTWGSGVGSQLSPKASSEAISGQTLGDYIMGKAAAE